MSSPSVLILIMKYIIYILFFVIVQNSLWARVPFNSKGKLERTHLIRFTKEELSHLRSIFISGKSNIDTEKYPEAYEYVYSLLLNRKVDEGTLFWFKKASEINDDTGSSSYMIRSYTQIGLKLAGKKVTNLQKASDDIAKNVLTDILRHGGVLPLQNILAQDISAAMRVGKIKDLAGWGGSFYYWHMPLLNSKGQLIKDPISLDKFDYLTVGDSIIRDNDKLKRFVMTFILCVTNTPYTNVFSDVPGLYKALLALNELPDVVRLPILRGINHIDPLMGKSLSVFFGKEVE